ncbi:hypothetical protein [Burkholderia contaminans]|uniref:hypothetical protein n=1 Tax=Burkholderia contaminans TaxID=488447 RepID=UPI00158885C8|nr:hypothetical protein [Burkholderia contaminans]
MEMTDQDKELFYKQLKEDIEELSKVGNLVEDGRKPIERNPSVSVEALRIYFEQSDESNYFTYAFASAMPLLLLQTTIISKKSQSFSK